MRTSSRITRHGAALAAALVIVLAAPAAAPAAGNLNAFITSMTPAQNARINVGAKPSFQVQSSCKGMGLQAYISKSSTVDGEGAFLGGDLQDQFPMPEVTFGSGIYDGTPQGTWLQQPGEYYWQVRTVAQCEGEVTTAWASQPVFIQVIGISGSDTTVDVTEQDNGELLTISQARAAISPAVRKAKKSTPRGLKRTCTRRGSGSILAIVCTASWNDRKKYSYNGTWRMALNDDGTIEARFDGRRALLTCVKRKRAQKRSVRGCFKKHRFAATVT